MTYVQEVHAAFWKCFVGGLVILTVALLFRQRAAGGQPQFFGLLHPGSNNPTTGLSYSATGLSPDGQFLVGNTFLWSKGDGLLPAVPQGPRLELWAVADDRTVIGWTRELPDPGFPTIWSE